MRNLTYLFFFVLLASSATAQITSDSWALVSSAERNSGNHPFFEELPERYITVSLDCRDVFQDLREAKQIMSIPNPKGEMQDYEVVPVSLVRDRDKNSRSAKTYRGHLTTDPNVQISLSIYDLAIYAYIYGPGDDFYIMPTGHGTDRSLVYYRRDELRSTHQCLVDHNEEIEKRAHDNHTLRNANIREFDIAFSAAGEYSQEFGGSPYDPQNVMNALTSGLALINPIFERDLGMTFMNATPMSLIFEDPVNDPFTDLQDGGQLLDQNQAQLNAINNLDYDIGHLIIWKNLGGLASVSSLCAESTNPNFDRRGKAFSGLSQSITKLWVDYVSHEIGHQVGSRHNHSSVSCNTISGKRYEPGDGSSIMSYAGLCGNSYQNSTDPYFHYASIEQSNAIAFNCGDNGSSINNPSVNVDVAALTIPKETPFILVGGGNAGEYNWIQYDGNGPTVSGPPTGTCTSCANFKYEDPISEATKYFPDYSQVLDGNNNSVTWQKLSSVARTMNFKLVGRNTVGISTEDVEVTVSQHGPLELISPNGTEEFSITETIEVTWDVNGTDNIAANLDILFSGDDGQTFTSLATNVPNDGSQNVQLNVAETTQGRILLIPSGSNAPFGDKSIFYEISDDAFGVGVAAKPVNDDYEDAIQGYQDIPIDGYLESATEQSSNPLTSECGSVTLDKDVWYKYQVSYSQAVGNTFNVNVNFDIAGDYGLEVTHPNVSDDFCVTSPPYTIDLSYNGTGLQNTFFYARVFKHGSAVRTGSSTSRALETFSITASGSALPVEFGEFAGFRNERVVNLAWSTLTELNVDRFQVMGSVDGENFEKIGSVVAVGESTQEIKYDYKDDSGKHVFYMIYSIDLDGTVDKSKVIYIPHDERDQKFKVFPSPSDGQLELLLPAHGDQVYVSIHDVQGKVVLERNFETVNGINYIDLDATHLDSGIYIVQVMGKELYTERIIIK